MTPVICPNCKQTNRAGARFCSTCRAALPADQSVQASSSAPSPALTNKVCPVCHAPNRIDAAFCNSCRHTFSIQSRPVSSRRVKMIRIGAIAAVVVLLATVMLVVRVAVTRVDQETLTPPVAASPSVAVDSPSPTQDIAVAAAATADPSTFDDQLNRSLLATVQILVPIDSDRDRLSTGSGSVLTDQGHVLTNFHVVGDPDTGLLFNRRGLVWIAVSPADLRSEPSVNYRAEILEVDQVEDLALLKVVASRDDLPLPADFSMISVPIGDSDTVRIGDELVILGYPGIGGESITLTRGSVSGFLQAEDWIKTDAEINPGNSGGSAVNKAGELVGIPTAGAFDEEFPGKLGLVRPVNQARRLIDRALREAGETP